MSAPTLVLDANAIMARGFALWLGSYRGKKVLPAVAFTELAVLHAQRRELGRFRSLLRKQGIEIEWFRAEEGERAAHTAAEVGDLRENARDHLIAAHVHGERILVTDNRKDFSFLREVWTPQEAMRRLR